MEPQARYTVVGASVLVVFGIVVATLAWLLTSNSGKTLRHYTLTFMHQSMDGLEENSEVHMKGIRVGSVARFAFSKQQPGGVDVSIDVDATAPVRTSTQAVVDHNLITGIATIRLVTLQENSPLLDRGDMKIAEGESQMQQVSQTLTQLAQQAGETMKRIDQTLSPQNQAALTQTLENMRRATSHAEALTKQTTTALASVGRSADALTSTMASARGDLGRLTDRYDTLGAQLDVELADGTAAVHGLSDAMSRLTVRGEDFLGDADIEMRITARKLRSAADAITGTSRRLGDPRTVIFGPPASSLGPGEGDR